MAQRQYLRDDEWEQVNDERGGEGEADECGHDELALEQLCVTPLADLEVGSPADARPAKPREQRQSVESPGTDWLTLGEEGEGEGLPGAEEGGGVGGQGRGVFEGEGGVGDGEAPREEPEQAVQDSPRVREKEPA